MAASTVIIFISVLHRYASGFAIPGLQDWLLSLNFGWAQELCIILFVWMAKIGAAYGVRTGIHVGVDIVINKMKDKPRAAMIHLGLACGALFTGMIGVFGLLFIWEGGMAYEFYTALGKDVGDFFEGPTTPDLEWPSWMVYAAVPVGSFLMCFRFLQVMWRFHQSGDLPHHDHGHVEGVDEVENLSVGEAIEIAEEIEHAHAGKSDAEWEKEHPRKDQPKKGQ